MEETPTLAGVKTSEQILKVLQDSSVDAVDTVDRKEEAVGNNELAKKKEKDNDSFDEDSLNSPTRGSTDSKGVYDIPAKNELEEEPQITLPPIVKNIIVDEEKPEVKNAGNGEGPPPKPTCVNYR